MKYECKGGPADGHVLEQDIKRKKIIIPVAGFGYAHYEKSDHEEGVLLSTGGEGL